MKTIEHKGIKLDVSESGDIFIHEREITRSNGAKQTFKRRKLKIYDNGNGYIYVSLCNGSHKFKEYVHRIVAIAYHENKDNLPQVNHIDGIRNNNHYSNLEWCTAKYNINDYVSKGRGVYSTKAVIQFNKEGLIVNEFKSIEDAGRQFPGTAENINCVTLGKGRTAFGFFWMLKENYKKEVHTQEWIKKMFINPSYKKVEVIDPSGKSIGVFENMSKAARFFDEKKYPTITAKISACVAGKRKHYKKYTFILKNENN